MYTPVVLLLPCCPVTPLLCLSKGLTTRLELAGVVLYSDVYILHVLCSSHCAVYPQFS